VDIIRNAGAGPGAAVGAGAANSSQLILQRIEEPLAVFNKQQELTANPPTKNGLAIIAKPANPAWWTLMDNINAAKQLCNNGWVSVREDIHMAPAPGEGHPHMTVTIYNQDGSTVGTGIYILCNFAAGVGWTYHAIGA
jgi:hypothetical protein